MKWYNQRMKYFMLLIVILGMILVIPVNIFASEDTVNFRNNKIGIHILFPGELSAAGRLVNSNGGDWGYVTIPVQVRDRNLSKWQDFMNDAKKHHVIPIIRIATEGYYFDSSVWVKSTENDILDFANFLNSLDWPVKDKYVVILNEVNRADEWQGEPNPGEYAHILDYAITAFKSVNKDFFIISAGLDNGAANSKTSINQYSFMTQMEDEIPGIFGKIDGLASHSYPNPGFSQPPWILTNKSVGSFRYERDLAEKLGRKKLPVFITETGWTRNTLSESKISSYMEYAFESVWSDEGVIAVTPFILQAGGPYAQFSLINEDGRHNEVYLAIEKLSKIKGEPILEEKKIDSFSRKENLISVVFPKTSQYSDNESNIDKTKVAVAFIKWFFKSLNVL